MNFLNIITTLLLIGNLILMWKIERSKKERSSKASELEKMHTAIYDNIDLMNQRLIALKALGEKIGNAELICESDKLLEGNAQLKDKLLLFTEAVIKNC